MWAEPNLKQTQMHWTWSPVLEHSSGRTLYRIVLLFSQHLRKHFSHTLCATKVENSFIHFGCDLQQEITQMSSSNFPICLNKVNNQVITFYFYCLPLFLCFLLNLSATQTFIANPSVYHCVIGNTFLTVGFQLSSSNPTTSC